MATTESLESATADLLAATIARDVAAIKRHLKAGANVNAETVAGNSVLHAAALGSSVEIVKTLIDSHSYMPMFSMFSHMLTGVGLYEMSQESSCLGLLECVLARSAACGLAVLDFS